MSKFKVGDKVRRTWNTFGKAVQGGVYEVREVSSFVGINLVGHEAVKGSYNYDYRGFELYLDDILTPIQAAEALFNSEALQVYDTDCEKWYTFSCGLRSITLEDLKSIKLRIKPKTIIINGVDVPAPMSSLPSEGFVWGVAGLERVYSLDAHSQAIPKHYWSTEEDAQKVLDAMVIPFK